MCQRLDQAPGINTSELRRHSSCPPFRGNRQAGKRDGSIGNYNQV